jgi:hypothetical protein
MLLDQSLDLLEFSGRESKVASERHGSQPELRGSVVAVDVNVRGLARLMAVEVYPIRARTQHRRHDATMLAGFGHAGDAGQPGITRPLK